MSKTKLLIFLIFSTKTGRKRKTHPKLHTKATITREVTGCSPYDKKLLSLLEMESPFVLLHKKQIMENPN